MPIDEFVLRTVVIHIGLFLLWSQSTALFTKEYWVKKYVFEIENKFWGTNKWETIKTICLPAIIITLALVYVLYKVPVDVLYNYEIVVSGIAAFCALPFWRSLEKYLYPVLMPFKDDLYRPRSINSLGACTVMAVVIDGILILQWNAVFYNIIAALISLLLLSFLILSSKMNFRYSYKNYYYLQFVSCSFSCGCFFIWFSYSLKRNYLGFINRNKYIYCYKIFGDSNIFFSWKRSRTSAWGFLGMAFRCGYWRYYCGCWQRYFDMFRACCMWLKL